MFVILWESGRRDDFQHERCWRRMNRFLNSELSDMHHMYGAVDGNGQATIRMYFERFPKKRQPNRSLFGKLHRRLREIGVFQVSCHNDRGCNAGTPACCRNFKGTSKQVSEKAISYYV